MPSFQEPGQHNLPAPSLLPYTQDEKLEFFSFESLEPPLHFFSEVVAFGHNDTLYFCGPNFVGGVARTMVTSLSLKNRVWSILSTNGQSPDPLMLFKKIPLHFFCNNTLYVIYSNSNLPEFRMDKLDMETLRWTRVSNNSSAPPPRDYQCGGLHGQSFFVYSVLKESPSSASLHRFDIETATWHCLSFTGPYPVYPSSGNCVVQGKLYVFSKHASKLHILSLDTLTWTAHSITEIPLYSSKRHSHLFQPFGNQLLIIRSCDHFQLCSFDLTTFKWKKIESMGKKPHQVRTEATTFIYKGFLFALGGQGGNQPQNHLCCMKLTPLPKEDQHSWLKNMLEDEFCDVVFCFEGNQKIKAHRCILAAKSDYFSAMFRGGFKEGISNQAEHKPGVVEIPIHSVSYEIFRALIHSYYHHLDLSTTQVNKMDLFQAASLFLNSSLQQELANDLSESLDVDNVLTVYRLANESPSKPSRVLKERAAQFFWDHFTTVTSTTAFLEMCENNSDLVQELCSSKDKYQKPSSKKQKLS